MLTTKQKELLVFIHARLQETGVPPSFEEMKEALDLQSKSGVHRLIMALEERGFIRRLPHRARAIEVIKLPDAMHGGAHGGAGLSGEGAQARPGFSPSVIAGSGRRSAQFGAGRLLRSSHQHPADGPHRCRRADQRYPESYPRHHGAP